MIWFSSYYSLRVTSASQGVTQMSPELVMDMSLGTGDRDVTSGPSGTDVNKGLPHLGIDWRFPPKHREVRFPVLPEKSSRRARSAIHGCQRNR